MNDTSGWIKIHRSILNWEWWDDHNTTRLFLFCLLEANHEDKKWHGENIERGTFITSLSHLSQNTGLSTQQIRTSLERLISTSEITKKTTNKLTKITICKYDIYQDVQQAEQQIEQQAIQQTNNKQITTTKEYKNIRNKKYKKEDTNVSSKKQKFDFFSALLEIGIDKSLATDWLIVRKNKRLSNTETALNRLKNNLEILKQTHNFTANDAIRIAVERSWGGVEVEYFKNIPPNISEQPNLFSDLNSKKEQKWE